MKKESIITAVIAVVLVAGILVFYAASKLTISLQPSIASSTQSSGISSSTSSTTPPTPLPVPAEKGIVSGTVVLGPTCPVEHNPPLPGCAPKPYETSVTISKNLENPSPFVTVQSDASGTFSASLPAGEYVLSAQGGSPYPRCSEQLVEVAAGQTATTTINCDTGIR